MYCWKHIKILRLTQSGEMFQFSIFLSWHNGRWKIDRSNAEAWAISRATHNIKTCVQYLAEAARKEVCTSIAYSKITCYTILAAFCCRRFLTSSPFRSPFFISFSSFFQLFASNSYCQIIISFSSFPLLTYFPHINFSSYPFCVVFSSFHPSVWTFFNRKSNFYLDFSETASSTVYEGEESETISWDHFSP